VQFSRNTFSSASAIALLAALVCFAIVLFAPGIFNDGDTYWHIAAGRWMIDNRAVLHIDPFSYTFAGHPWQAHEWLAEIVIALSYVGLGWNGVAFLFAAAFALTAGLLSWHLAKRLGGISLIATVALSLSCAAASLLARPHLLALPLLEIWTAALIFACDGKRAPSWKLLPVMVLWANLHSSFLFGLLLIVPFALEAALEKPFDAKQTKRWVLFGMLAVLAAMLTPYGVESLLFPFKLMAMPELYAINEWQPADLNGLQPLTLAAATTLFVLLSRGAKIKPWRLIVLLGLFYLALAHGRHQMLLAIAGPLLLAGPLARALANSPRRGAPSRIATLAFVLAIGLLTGLRLAWPVQRSDNATTPGDALAHVPANIVHAPVFNDYAFGGYLIFNDVHPFIDGRAELYGEDFLQRYDRMTAPDLPVLTTALTKYHIRWTILAPSNRAVFALDNMPGWHRLYADRFAIVHVKDGAP